MKERFLKKIDTLCNDFSCFKIKFIKVFEERIKSYKKNIFTLWFVDNSLVDSLIKLHNNLLSEGINSLQEIHKFNIIFKEIIFLDKDFYIEQTNNTLIMEHENLNFIFNQLIDDIKLGIKLESELYFHQISMNEEYKVEERFLSDQQRIRSIRKIELDFHQKNIMRKNDLLTKLLEDKKFILTPVQGNLQKEISRLFLEKTELYFFDLSWNLLPNISKLPNDEKLSFFVQLMFIEKFKASLLYEEKPIIFQAMLDINKNLYGKLYTSSEVMTVTQFLINQLDEFKFVYTTNLEIDKWFDEVYLNLKEFFKNQKIINKNDELLLGLWQPRLEKLLSQLYIEMISHFDMTVSKCRMSLV